MPTKIFEVEILTSLKKMKMRKEQKAQVAGGSRVKVGSSTFEKEL